MLNVIVLHLALGYILSILSQVGASFNWSGFKNEVNAKLRELIPWALAEGEAEKFTSMLIGVVAGILQDKDVLQELLTDLADKKFDEAAAALKQLVEDNYKPTTWEGQALLALLDGHEPPPKPAPVQTPAQAAGVKTVPPTPTPTPGGADPAA